MLEVLGRSSPRRRIDAAGARLLARWPWLEAIRAGKAEISTLVTILLAAGLSLSFGIVASEMTEGETHAFDRVVMFSMRNSLDRSDPIGPEWLEEAVRDVTSLGSNAVLIILSLGAVGYLALSGALRAALLLLVSVGCGAVLVQFLKQVFGRVRPDLVSNSLSELTASFPSGHATLAAVTYLTLGALLARVERRTILKMYLLGVGVLLTLLVGISRVYLGLHWPTDVLAGWCLGAAWAIACWLSALWLQGRPSREAERFEPATAPSQYTRASCNPEPSGSSIGDA